MNDESHDESHTSLKPLLVLALGVFTLWLITWISLTLSFSNWSERGQFGDMFGAVNSLFSGLAFAGVIFTIYLQRKELSLQRAELSLTRTQLSRSADAQEKSEEALAKQVEALDLTARLNALSSVIKQYDTKIARAVAASEHVAAQKKQLEYINKLEIELNNLYQQ